MKIALVLDRFDPRAGGLEQWTHRFARHLIEAGHDVHVVAFAAANFDLPVGMHLVAPGRASATGKRIACMLAALDADVVHDSGTSDSGDVFHPQTGSRLLSSLRAWRSEGPGARVRAAVSPRMAVFVLEAMRLEARQAARAKKIVAVSRRVRDLLARRHGVDEARVVVIPNGVDTQFFTPELCARLREGARARLEAGDAVVFLAVAHNLRLKGVDTAMRTLGRLAAEGHDARLVVAGGAADAEWRRLAQSLGVSERVRFLGPVAAVEELYAAADVVVHPTRWDACSLVTIEGMACGLPVITTAVNGAAELIADGRDGFVVDDPEDAEALAGRMRLLMKAETRRSIGIAARLAASAYDIRDNCRAVEDTLRAAARH